MNKILTVPDILTKMDWEINDHIDVKTPIIICTGISTLSDNDRNNLLDEIGDDAEISEWGDPDSVELKNTQFTRINMMTLYYAYEPDKVQCAKCGNIAPVAIESRGWGIYNNKLYCSTCIHQVTPRVLQWSSESTGDEVTVANIEKIPLAVNKMTANLYAAINNTILLEFIFL